MPCTELCATQPPSPFSHTRTFVVEGRGLPSSINEGYHAGVAREVDATFKAARGVGSRIVVPPNCWEGVLVDASPEPSWVCSTMRGIFRVQFGGGEGRGVLSLSLGGLLLFGRLGARHKTAYYHYLPGHHFRFGPQRINRYSCCLFFLSGSLRFC